MLATLELSRGKYAILDAADLPLVQAYSWCAAPHDKTWYALTKVGGRTVYLHRLLLNASHGMETDHINGNGLDCRRTNLRLASRSQNVRNTRLQTRNTSGFKGVYRHSSGKQWAAYITFQGRTKYLGIFHDVVDAAEAYDGAARRLFGEFACLNFPRRGEQGCREEKAV